MRSVPVLFAAAVSLLGCVHFPNAQLIHGAGSVQVVQGPVVCGPLGFKKVPLQARWGEYVRVLVTAPSALSGTALVHANGSALSPVEWSASTPGAVILDTRFANEDPDQHFMLQREQPIDITLTGLHAAAGGSCEGAVFTIEHGPLVPDIDERAWVAELERRGGPELAARREAARVEAEARRQAHYAAWEARRQQAEVSAEVLAQADAIRQAHYAAWDARHQVTVEAQGEVVANADVAAAGGAEGSGQGGGSAVVLGGASVTGVQSDMLAGAGVGGGQSVALGGASATGNASVGGAGAGVALGNASVGGAGLGTTTVGVAAPHADLSASVDGSGFACAEAPTVSASMNVSISSVSSAATSADAAPSLCPAGMIAVPVGSSAATPQLTTAHVDETVRVNGTASAATEWTQPFDDASWSQPSDAQLRGGTTVTQADTAWSQPTDAQLRTGTTVVAGAQVQGGWSRPSDAQLRGGTTQVEAGWSQPSDVQLRGGVTVTQTQAGWSQQNDVELRGGATVTQTGWSQPAVQPAPPPVTMTTSAPNATVQVDVVTPALVQLLFDVAALGVAAPCPPPQPCAEVHSAAPVR